jgi:hypothetical protein
MVYHKTEKNKLKKTFCLSSNASIEKPFDEEVVQNRGGGITFHKVNNNDKSGTLLTIHSTRSHLLPLPYKLDT